MRFVHFTTDTELIDDVAALPRPIESSHGVGIFVYPYRESHMPYFTRNWSPGQATFWTIPKKSVREVQRIARSTLARANPPFDVIELFVLASDFDKLRRSNEAGDK